MNISDISRLLKESEKVASANIAFQNSALNEIAKSQKTALKALQSSLALNDLAVLQRTIETTMPEIHALKDWRKIQQAHEDLSRPFKPIHDDWMKIQRAYEEALLPLQPLIEKIRINQESNLRFFLPIKSSLDEVSKSLPRLPSMEELGLSTEKINLINQSIAEINHPWLDAQNSLRSLTAVTELNTIAKGLQTFPPFHEKITNILRQGLGDWRSPTEIPKSVYTDPIERLCFYKEQGFNQDLTNFPAPAFHEILENSGLLIQDPPQPVDQYNNGLGFDLINWDKTPKLNRESYKVIYSVETSLRRFIDEKMTAHFGRNWTKHQTPPGMYQEWKEKAKKAQSAGEPQQPLISYADFSDYLKIVERKDNWEQVFCNHFQRKTDFQESMTRLQPVRICTMHARTIQQEDYLLLLFEAHRIFKAIKN